MPDPTCLELLRHTVQGLHASGMWCGVLSLVVGCTSDRPTYPLPEPDAGLTDHVEVPTADGSEGGCAPSDDAAAGCFPEEIAAIVGTKCQRCHDTVEALADCLSAGGCLRGPFPLATWQDTQAMFSGRPIYERMGAAVEAGFMPLQSASVMPPVADLTDSERAALLEWTGACAPPGDSCTP